MPVREENFGLDYKFSDRISWFHELMFARRFCREFSMQLGLAYSHFNKVDTNYTNDVASISILGRVRVSPQSSIILAFEQPIIVNYDPAFIVRYPNHWLDDQIMQLLTRTGASDGKFPQLPILSRSL